MKILTKLKICRNKNLMTRKETNTDYKRKEIRTAAAYADLIEKPFAINVPSIFMVINLLDYYYMNILNTAEYLRSYQYHSSH